MLHTTLFQIALHEGLLKPEGRSIDNYYVDCIRPRGIELNEFQLKQTHAIPPN